MEKEQMALASYVLVIILLVPLFVEAPAVQGQATPTVSFSYPPEDEIVSGTVEVTGTATDAALVELKVDAEDQWGQATGTDQWSFMWDTTTLSDSSHVLFVRARNGTAVSEVESIRTHVNNTPPEFISMDASATPTDIGPRENITVSGFLEYDTGVKLKDAVVNVNISGAGIHVTTDSDDTGYFIKVIQGPADAGFYTLRISTNDGTLEEAREFEITVTAAYQPDLKVSKIELNPEEPKTEETVKIFATIENLGNQEATGKVKFYVDGGLLDSKNVNVDKSTIVKAVWTARPGNHTIRVEVTDVVPVDRDPSNNEASIVVVPRPEPDVAILDMAPSNPTPRQGQKVTVLVRLENRGDAGTTGTLKLYDGAPSRGILLTEKAFTINANETLAIYLVWNPIKGDHTLHAVISMVGQEPTDEHAYSRTVTVLPPIKKEEKSTPGPGLSLAMMALTSMAVLLAFRRRP